MLQRALQVTTAHRAPEILNTRKPLDARGLLRSWADHGLLILRRLGEFYVIGGPMS